MTKLIIDKRSFAIMAPFIFVMAVLAFGSYHPLNGYFEREVIGTSQSSLGATIFSGAIYGAIIPFNFLMYGLVGRDDFTSIHDGSQLLCLLISTLIFGGLISAAVFYYNKKTGPAILSVLSTSILGSMIASGKLGLNEMCAALGIGIGAPIIMIVLGLVLHAHVNGPAKNQTALGGIDAGTLGVATGIGLALKDRSEQHRRNEISKTVDEIRRCKDLGQNRSAELLEDKVRKLRAG